MIIKVMVAAENAEGVPDFYFCRIRCTDEQYNNGDHYVLAEQKAKEDGYTPKLAFDENDDGGKLIMHNFDWKNVIGWTV